MRHALKGLYGHKRTTRRAPATNMYRYEAMKQEWATLNPGATGAQYEAAMRKIAQYCGV